MGYAIRITTRAVEVVSGADQTPGIVAAESSSVKVGLRGKWGRSELRSWPAGGKLVPQGSGWSWKAEAVHHIQVTTLLVGFRRPVVYHLQTPSPYPTSAASAPSTPQTGFVGLGYPSGSFGPPPIPGGMQASASLGPPPRSPAPGTRTSSFGSTYSPQNSTPEPNDLNVSNMPSSVSEGAPTLLNSSNGDEVQIAPPSVSRKVVPKKDD